MFLHFRYYRQALGISLEDFAQRINMPPSNLSYKERGLQPYKWPQLARTVQELGIPLHWLVEIAYTPRDDLREMPLPPRENLIHIPCCYSKGG